MKDEVKDEEDEVAELKDRLAAYNIDSDNSPEPSGNGHWYNVVFVNIKYPSLGSLS